MPEMYCPNPDCPERLLAGPASEYADDITMCPLCGSHLVAEKPVFTSEPKGVAGQAQRPRQHGCYRHEWAEYRRRRKKRWVMWLLWLVCGPVAFFLHDQFPGSLLANAAAAAILAWFLVSLGTAEYRYQTWPCPKCNKSFMGWWWFRWEFAQSCLHCSLPKWQGE